MGVSKRKMQTDVRDTLAEALDDDDMATFLGVLLEEVADLGLVLSMQFAPVEPILREPERTRKDSTS